MSIDTSSGWVFLKNPIPEIDTFKYLCPTLNYKKTDNGLIRFKFSHDLDKILSEYFDLSLDVGVYLTYPGWSYPYHCDNTRNCAFNQLLCTPDTGFISKMKFDEIEIDIPYSDNFCCLINVANPHNIRNATKNKMRYLLNIGVEGFLSFETVVRHLKQRKMI